VNFAALPVGRAEFLVEKGPLIHHLSAERDLLPVSAQLGTGLLALGDPSFGATEQSIATVKSVYRGAPSSCAKFVSMRFEPLPESARETDTIAALWKRGAELGEVTELRRSAAGEAAFKRDAPGKRVLHLATHGFFLGGCPSGLDSGSVRGENPLLLSGVALAGANLRHTASARSEDGILTAEEIAAMDLAGVEWAVLSACETGLGELKAGEGVFGLRRAFQVAGARTVIMSLWPVDDSLTRQWMTTLYSERFLRHRGTAEAVRDADLSVLRRLRSANRSTHPFYWAAFVAAGDWR
jgi:CHAT domain-containing protein